MKGVLMYSARTNNMMYFDCNCRRRIYVYETSSQCFVYFQSFSTQIFSYTYLLSACRNPPAINHGSCQGIT